MKAKKARPVADHSSDITEPTRTLTVTGRPGSSKRTMVGPRLPITATKLVTCKASRRCSRAGSARRMGSDCRMAARPTRMASAASAYCVPPRSCSTSPSAIRLAR